MESSVVHQLSFNAQRLSSLKKCVQLLCEGDLKNSSRLLVESIHIDGGEDFRRIIIESQKLGIIVQAYKYIQKGIKYMNEGNYSKALDKYCVINPAEIPAELAFQLIHNKGICFVMLENYDEAIRSFQQSLQLEHKHCSSMGNMAFTLMITHNFSDALDVFQEMVHLDNIPPPRLLTVLYGMAECRLHAQSGSQSIASPTETTSKDSTDSLYRNYWSPKSHTSYDGKQQPIYDWYVNPMRSNVNKDKSGSIKPTQQAEASTAGTSLQSAVDQINSQQSPQQVLSKMRRDQLQKAIHEFESSTIKLNGFKCASTAVEHKQAYVEVLSPSLVGRGIVSISTTKDMVLPRVLSQDEAQEQLKSSSNDLPSLFRNTSIKGTKSSNIATEATLKSHQSLWNKNAAALEGLFLLSDDFFKTPITQTAAITVDLAGADKPSKHKGNTCDALKVLTLSTVNKYSSQSSTSSVSVDSATMENTKVHCYMDTPACLYYRDHGMQMRSIDSSPVDNTSGKTYTSDAMVNSTMEYDVDTGRLMRLVDDGNGKVETAVEYTKVYSADKLTTADSTMMYKKVYNEKEIAADRFVAHGAICTVDTEASTSNNSSMFKTLIAASKSPERFPKQTTSGNKLAVSHDYSRSDFFSFVERMNRSKRHGAVTATNEEVTPFDYTVRKSSFTPVPRFSVIPKTRDVEKYVLDQTRIFDHRQRVDEYVTTSSDLLVPTLRAPEETMPMSFIKSSNINSIISSKAQSSEYYPYALLRTPGPFPVGIDVRYRELYLNDTEFESVFGTIKKNWSSIPLWKQISMKKAAGLF